MTIDFVALRKLQAEIAASEQAARFSKITAAYQFNMGVTKGLRFALAALREAEDKGEA